MKTLCITLITILLANQTFTAIVSADPNVNQDESYLFDLRNMDTKLREHSDDMITTVYSTSNNIDVSAKKAVEIFKELSLIEQVERVEYNMRMKYILHTNVERDAGSNRLLEEWAMESGPQGVKNLVVRLRMLDLNQTQIEEQVHETMVRYHCKHWADVDEYFCLPDLCDFSVVKPPKDPVKVCVNNYRQSQMTLNVVNEATNTQEPRIVGEEIQLLIVHCIQTQIETVKIYGENVCYYEGFKPENMLTYEEMKASIIANKDWVETEEAGTFQRTTVIKEWQIDTQIDTSVPKMTKEQIQILQQNDPDALLKIEDQLGSVELDMSKGTTVEFSGSGSD
jgi:hypothetical protein